MNVAMRVGLCGMKRKEPAVNCCHREGRYGVVVAADGLRLLRLVELL